MWAKEKMLVTDIFSFSLNVSYKNIFQISIMLILLSANLFNLNQSAILLFGKGLEIFSGK